MVELLLLAQQACVEMVSDALIDRLDAMSVVVEDADANTRAESPLFGEPGAPVPNAGWPHSLLRALFSDEARATRAATVLLAQDWAQSVKLHSMQLVEDQDWVRLTQSQFAAIEISAGFWVVPSWHEPPAEAKCVMRLDPGLAFGTGTHATTRMCLRWTAQHAPVLASRWCRVLDYGCGSGILAIGAVLHGARHVVAVDIDPIAVEATRVNALANGVALHAGGPEVAQGCYGLVFANILATPLQLLAPLLCSYLEVGAMLVLAGILERQAEEMKVVYAPWLALDACDGDDGWVLMTGQRLT